MRTLIYFCGTCGCLVAWSGVLNMMMHTVLKVLWGLQIISARNHIQKVFAQYILVHLKHLLEQDLGVKWPRQMGRWWNLGQKGYGGCWESVHAGGSLLQDGSSRNGSTAVTSPDLTRAPIWVLKTSLCRRNEVGIWDLVSHAQLSPSCRWYPGWYLEPTVGMVLGQRLLALGLSLLFLTSSLHSSIPKQIPDIIKIF